VKAPETTIAERDEQKLSVAELQAELLGSMAAYETIALALEERLAAARPEEQIEFILQKPAENKNNSTWLKVAIAKGRITDGASGASITEQLETPVPLRFKRSDFLSIRLGGMPGNHVLDFHLTKDATHMTSLLPAGISLSLNEGTVLVDLVSEAKQSPEG